MIHLQPLRERPEDLPYLIEFIINRHNRRFNKNIKGITKDALGILMSYSWGGNVSELENAIERSLSLADGDKIEAQNLPVHVGIPKASDQLTIPDFEYSIKKLTTQLEETLVKRALNRTGGNRTQAARILEISHRALLYKIKEYGIT